MEQEQDIFIEILIMYRAITKTHPCFFGERSGGKRCVL